MDIGHHATVLKADIVVLLSPVLLVAAGGSPISITTSTSELVDLFLRLASEMISTTLICDWSISEKVLREWVNLSICDSFRD